MTKIHSFSLIARDLHEKNTTKTQLIDSQSDKICIKKINYTHQQANLKSTDKSPYLFNTLAQLAINCKSVELQQQKNSSKTQTIDTLKKRARSKYITASLAHELYKVEDSSLHWSYKNTLDCASVVEQKGQKLKSTYCGNRYCLVCNRIRTAKLINGYMPVLEQMKQPVFLTLTIPNVTAGELRTTIEDMSATFRTIIHRYTSRTKTKIDGVRKIECTYNPDTDTYHPHFHAIIDGWHNAEMIKQNWLKTYENAVPVAQDIRPCKNRDSFIELFKYFTKVLTNKREFYPQQMDVIFTAMRKKRVYQPFGNIHPVQEEIDEIQVEEYKDIANDNRLWTWYENDWIDLSTGECLSGYVVEPITQKLCDNIGNQERPSPTTPIQQIVAPG